MKDMCFEACYNWLLEIFKKKKDVAKFLGISESHLRSIRNKNASLTPRMREYILNRAIEKGFNVDTIKS